jgi:serine/threonine protein phosphatase 1
MARQFVVGDIHGNYKALIQCFERCRIDYNTDQLICLGDIYDGYPDSYEVAEELLKLNNLIMIMGNHDVWMYDYFTKGSLEYLHLSQGGQASIDSYQTHGIPDSHITLLESTLPYYIDGHNRLFVHGGFDVNLPIEQQSIDDLTWDRSLIHYAYNCEHTKSCTIPNRLKIFNEIYIGHTTVENYNSTTPLRLCNVWCMDTGAGYDGKLSIMDINTKEFWQSDTGTELYGSNQGR